MIQSLDLSGGKRVAVRPAKIAELRDAVAAGFSEGPAAPYVIASRALASGAVSRNFTALPSRSTPSYVHSAGRSTL
jgi:hypothetical protein